MHKIIYKTAAVALSAITLLFVLSFGILSLAAPRAMAGAFESYGAYGIAAGYSSLSYVFTGDVDDIRRAVDDCTASGDDKGVVAYGERLFSDKKFDAYYSANPYRAQVYYMQYSASLYREGNAAKACLVARDALLKDTSVPSALGSLTILVAESKDKATAKSLLEIYGQAVDESKLSESQLKYYQAIKNVLSRV